jgi:hypothetical protein
MHPEYPVENAALYELNETKYELSDLPQNHRFRVSLQSHKILDIAVQTMASLSYI